MIGAAGPCGRSEVRQAEHRRHLLISADAEGLVVQVMRQAGSEESERRSRSGFGLRRSERYVCGLAGLCRKRV